MKNIFIIEDNLTNFMFLEEILSDYNVKLAHAKDGKQFYSIIQNQTINFDLILMDLMLPDTDGIELTKFLIKEKCRTPIIFISAYTERCEEIFNLGIKYFISKPVKIELFLGIVGKYIILKKLNN